MFDRKMVCANGQFFDDVFAGESGIECQSEMTGLADQNAMGSESGAVGVSDCQAQLSRAVLRAQERRTKQQEDGAA